MLTLRLRLGVRLRHRNRRAKRPIGKNGFDGQPFGIEEPLRIDAGQWIAIPGGLVLAHCRRRKNGYGISICSGCLR